MIGRATCIPLILLSVSLAAKRAHAQDVDAKESAYSWQSQSPIVAPDYERFFGEDPDAGRRLDEWSNNRFRGINEDEEMLRLVHAGFRSAQRDRVGMLSQVGSRCIWNKNPQHPLAIEIMYHAMSSPDRGERYRGMYSGLSVVKPKSEAILAVLVEAAMATDDHNVTGRIAWGAAEQSDALIAHLAAHLESPDPNVRSHAKALQQIFSGELNAREYWEARERQRIEPEYGPQMEEIRARVQSGDSEARRAAFETIRRHQLWLLFDDRDAWLEALLASTGDSDAMVRNWAVQHIGSGWVWMPEAKDARAIDALLKLAEDPDREVRKSAMYYGLSRLPKDHPAQSRIEVVKKAEFSRGIEHLKQVAMQLIADGKLEDVEDLLHEINPKNKTGVEGDIDWDKARALYNEIEKALREAQKETEEVR